MANRDNLKGYFEAGDRPKASQFGELIDNTVNKIDDKASDAEAVNVTIDDKFITPKTANTIVTPLITAIDSKEPAIAADTANKFWSGAKTFRDLGTDVRNILLDGFSSTLSGAVQASDKLIEALSKLQNQIGLKQDKLKSYTLTDAATANLKTINGNSIIYDPAIPNNNNIIIGGGTKIIVMPLSLSLIGGTANSAQNALPDISLLANKSYMFKGKIFLTFSATIPTRTTSFGFNSTNVLPVIEYVVKSFSVASNGTVATSSNTAINSSGLKVINTTNSIANTVIEFEGVIRTNSIATLSPKISFSVTTNSTNNVVTVRSGSYAEFIELGADTFIGS